MKRLPSHFTVSTVRSLMMTVCLVILLISIDQYTKQQIAISLNYGQDFPIADCLSFRYVVNHGVAFGMLSQVSIYQRLFLIGIAAIAVILGIIQWLIASSTIGRIAMVLIISGALGNVLDRMYLGYVIDFIDFHIGSWHFPIFNIADIYISLGAITIFMCHICERGIKVSRMG